MFRVRASTDSVDGQLLSLVQHVAAGEQVTTGRAAYPEMEPEDTRLATFSAWPTSSSIRPDTLARAGFFYTGHSDNVKCFFCNGSLRNWETGDNPWQEHAKWFPRCEYLLQSRGLQYINNVQQSFFNTSELEVVLQVGFEQTHVESLVQSRSLHKDHHYTSVSNLVADILQAEEERRQGSDNMVLVTLSAEEQLRQLQEERTCKVCMDKLVSIVFIPCGHLVVCSECAASLQQCPICRAVIRGSAGPSCPEDYYTYLHK